MGEHNRTNQRHHDCGGLHARRADSRDEERAKTLRCIEQLEKQARAEKQPRRKWELAEEAKRLKIGMEG
ncbi:MAG: DUF4391 domain-containing protein [Treponema sp.]|nr:DUF4391 domain-containing protein [Treponema sp.]